MMRYIERAFPYLLLLPVLLPVIVWSGLIYPYLVPKTLSFYAVSLVTLAAAVLLITHSRPFYFARLSRREAWIPGALLALAYVASLFGIDFYRSFWSLFIRGDGLLMLTCAVASFYLILLIADRAFFTRLVRAVAAVGTFVAVYGIGEWLFSGGRIGGLLGNAAFFAGYLTLAFFATLMAAEGLPGFWHRAAYVGATLEAVAIVLSATRGSILALGAAFVAALAFLAWKGEGKQRRGAGLTLFALVILSGLFFGFRSELAAVPFEPISRIASISTADPDVASRLFIWKNMVGQIAKAPILGVGAEHIDVLFNRFYDPTQILEEWFDRSHNAFLDYAAQYGIGGLLLYLALIASFLTAARRLARRGEARLAALGALLALAYAVGNFFVFDTISSFWLLLALLAAFLALSYPDEAAEPLLLSRWTAPASWVAALVLLYFIIPVAVRPALAAHDLVEAYLYQLVDVPKEAAYLSDGFALGTYGNLESGYEAYEMYVTNQQYTLLKGDARVEAYDAALKVLTADFKRFPYDARTALYLAHVLALAPPGTTPDKTLLSDALDRAISFSPKRAQPWFILVNLSLGQANKFAPKSAERLAGYAAARDILSRYIKLVPNLSESHFVMAQLDFASGDKAAAAKEAALGKADYAPDLHTALRAAGYYEAVKDWTNAAFFLKSALALDPSDNTSRFDLAKVLYLSGDYAGAESVVVELRNRDPDILTTDPNFSAAITAYEQSTH